MKKILRCAFFVAATAIAGSCATTTAERAEVAEVRKAIDDAGFDAVTLDLSAQGSVITIGGTVEDDTTRDQIVEAARSAPGVTEVIDLISTNDKQLLPEDEQLLPDDKDS